jgi:hypothetical protein
MTPRKRFLLKNRMGLANLVSNLVGAVGVNALLAPTRVLTTSRAQEYGPVIEAVFTPTVFAIAIAATLIYQRPIRRYVDMCHLEAASPAPPTAIQRRVLNEPFFAVAHEYPSADHVAHFRCRGSLDLLSRQQQPGAPAASHYPGP